MIKLSPSLLSADFSNLSLALDQCKEGGTSMVHIDVMDGHFVPNITMGPVVVKGVRRATDQILDVHLMIENPDRYITDFAKAGSDMITVHIETCPKVREVFQQIRNEGVRPGITLRPSTDLETIEDTLEDVDLVLVMSVEPGFSGQTFIPGMMDRIAKVREWVDKMENGRPEISVDGDVKLQNAREVTNAGADIVVSGSGVFGTDDPVTTMKEFAAIDG
ncbi:MAG: ribulose-phosphate 3-epimerase [Candidatus Marinimicrobia bacterium]|nr:ribulose-phosphate 3-epimerase [Candidatus Neomarinimicrobiota bacterium]MDP6594185.1 ribulose-phosphate 3-epimerase [Candidatus Neomarinimicrobiota bacterium]MDP6837042.1 ribulose-phosphate 3-epimerase [Candidatus Neomarinimicrobiota bacterium]